MRSKVKICLCPKSIAWIGRHLVKSARAKWKAMIFQGFIVKGSKRNKKRRTAKQLRATRKLIAFNKRRRN